MPASAKTPNFDLPQYRNLDTVSMLVTFNGAMQKIDTALQNIKTTADVGSTDIDDLQQSVDRLTTEVAALNQGLGNLGWRRQSLTFLSTGNTEYIAWVNNNNEMLLSVGNAFNSANVPKLPNQGGTGYLYAFCTTPDNIFNIEVNNKIYYLGHTVILRDAGESSYGMVVYRFGVMRDNNITYIGIWTNENAAPKFTVGLTGSILKIQK